jgi:pimeloyl-ACP methyl ester carboxylesterase
MIKSSIHQKFQIAIFMILSLFLLPASSSSQDMFSQSADIKPDKSGYAPVNGMNIYYEVFGEGPAVVLLHGAYMTIYLNWSQLIPELTKTRKVIALELQGHGHTADSDRPFNYADLAKDVAGVMKHLKLDSADVIGYSFGGTIAYEFAIQYPELVKKLIILSSVYKYEGWLQEVRDVLNTFDPAFLDQTPLKSAYEAVAPNPAQWRKFVEKFIAFDTQSFTLGADRVKTITCPVLIVSGDNDGVDLDHLVETYRLLGGGRFGDMSGVPQSHLAILPGTTHVGLMMDTKKLVDVLIPFLQIKNFGVAIKGTSKVLHFQ